MAYVAIPDADLTGNAPAKQAVFRQMRDNIVALYNDSRAYAYKTADETVNNATTGSTLQDDDDLIFAVKANETWHLHMSLLVTTTTNAHFKISVVGPAGATGTVRGFYTSEAPNGRLSDFNGALGAAISFLYVASPTRGIVVIEVNIHAGATAGNVTFQWAQDVSHADNTTVGEGSILVAHRTSAV